MIRTLLLSSLLLWASCAHPQPVGILIENIGVQSAMTHEQLIEGDFDDPCLAKMEAAMRAMEFWSVLNFEKTEQVNLNIVKPFPYDNYWAVLPDEEEWIKDSTAYGLTQTLNALAGRAIVLWDQAKRDCWKGTK
jgi:hypothetical protein